MKTLWIVDFENVQEYGISQIKTEKQDEVMIGYTSNVPKISMDVLANLSAKISFLKAETGKQSLDLCIATELGRQISRRSPKTRFVIVSDDNGYSHICNYWNEKGVNVERFSPGTTNGKNHELWIDAAAKKQRGKSASSLDAINKKLMKYLAGEGIGSEEVGRIASITIKSLKKGKSSEETQALFAQAFGKKTGREYFQKVAKLA